LKRRMLVIGVVLAGLTAGNCKSTKLLTSWKNPNYAGQRFHKILVVGMSNNPATRADFEDALSHKIARNGVEAMPGNSILLRPDTSKIDLDYLRTQIREHEMDAVVVSRLVKVDKDVTYIPGRSYVIPYGYYHSLLWLLRRRVPAGLHSGLLARRLHGANRNQSICHHSVKLVVKELEKEAILPGPGQASTAGQ
jgi:hypothetical protein